MVFFGLRVVVDQGGVDLLLHDFADEVVADALLESHALLPVVLLQHPLVGLKGRLGQFRGNHEESTSREVDLGDVEDALTGFVQQAVLDVLGTILFLVDLDHQVLQQLRKHGVGDWSSRNTIIPD